jgi:uncharacterized protein (TIGR02757 family)
LQYLSHQLLKEFLEEKYNQYNRTEFIESDPVQIPHHYIIAEDIEIAGFMTSIIAWGQRKAIISNASKLMHIMGNSPCDFVINANDLQLERLKYFVHRTFQGEDCTFFIKSLRNIYKNHNGLRGLFEAAFFQFNEIPKVLIHFRLKFFEIECLSRTFKHIADIEKGASAKRLNMFLRWMVRNDLRGVDFGLWKSIPASALYIPLDLHSGNVARKLGLLTRKQNDWKSVEELTSNLRKFDSSDPVKYDFALFGLGVFEKF